MRQSLIVLGVALGVGFAAAACSSPAECRQFRDCCAALQTSMPQMATSCAAASQVRDANACAQGLNGLRMLASTGMALPAACGGTATAAAPPIGMPGAPPGVAMPPIPAVPQMPGMPGAPAAAAAPAAAGGEAGKPGAPAPVGGGK